MYSACRKLTCSGAAVRPEQLRRDAGGPAVGHARARKVQGGRADAGARGYGRRCVPGSGAVQDAERAGRRGGPWLLLEVCGRVRSCTWGLFGDAASRGPAARSFTVALPQRRHRWAP
ncbi:hypothetical protein NDU88_006700 [Pleurodeles waltl]|uniref:Uncharacterized protein n=1 Tax=Pleurodeles waltl TaxID=8319 RepID=A0AAV7SQN9_PLEWA|nr:hypothetical protein NDU88_006700 [Pleurodeles waltl]